MLWALCLVLVSGGKMHIQRNMCSINIFLLSIALALCCFGQEGVWESRRVNLICYFLFIVLLFLY